MLADLGLEVSAAQVARLYADFLDIYIVDEKDAESRAEIEGLGIKVCVTNTVMTGQAEKLALAKRTLAECAIF
jgi:LPPG:FO 2-phospho-L-lactate transferase